MLASRAAARPQPSTHNPPRHPARAPAPCRRFQWLFVRIEVELRKLQAYKPELGVLVPLAGHPVPQQEREELELSEKL